MDNFLVEEMESEPDISEGCEDIQVMWKDATGFVTSFKTKQLPSLLLATALGG